MKWALVLLLLVQADAYCIKKGSKCPKNHDAVAVFKELGLLVAFALPDANAFENAYAIIFESSYVGKAEGGEEMNISGNGFDCFAFSYALVRSTWSFFSHAPALVLNLLPALFQESILQLVRTAKRFQLEDLSM